MYFRILNRNSLQIMIVLEFMCNGDLKQFLEAKQPL